MLESLNTLDSLPLPTSLTWETIPMPSAMSTMMLPVVST